MRWTSGSESCRPTPTGSSTSRSAPWSFWTDSSTSGGAGTTFINANYRVGFGGDLSKDHPISFEYTPALATADGELYDPTATDSGLGDKIDVDMLFDNGSGVKTKVECASCHDVHNSKSAGNSKLLLIANNDSALCLTCHNK